ncbi:NAD-P-binding protein [Mycena epipterygia]|nr:NAD-P-binding protein [Mycena epipterygia]
MSLPDTTRHYYFPKVGEVGYIALTSSPLRSPQADEVLVKIHAVSLQARDLAVAHGTLPSVYVAHIIPGSDMAGEILAVGDSVAEWKQGDRVCANVILDHTHGDLTPAMLESALGAAVHGVLTQYMVLPSHSLVKIPAHLSYEEASTLPCAALTAFNALNGLEPVKAGDTVLVLGTGGVATFCLQFAVAAGATVIVASSSDAKLAQAKAMGAAHGVNYKTTPAWDEEVLRLTGGAGVDHVLEIGGSGTLARSMNAVRMAGTIAIIGVKDTKTEFPDITFPSIMKGIKFHGIQIGSVELFRQMMAFISNHFDGTRPVVAKVFPFEQAREAYEYLEAGGHVGKVVIQVAKS